MLEKIDLKKCLEKSDYRGRIADLERTLNKLQREARELSIPVIIVFEGWGAAGKGTLINSLILSMDPRGFNVYNTKPPTEEEMLRPFLWRFWTKLPEAGRIAIFDRSWYGRVVGDRVDENIGKKEAAAAFDQINAFERQLANDGTVIIKLFLHISRKEQKKRLKALEADPVTAWKVTRDDWKHHNQYDEYVPVIEEMLKKTSTASAGWTVVAAHDQRFAIVTIFSTVIAAIQRAVGRKFPDKRSGAAVAGKKVRSVLDRCDMSLSLDPVEYGKKIEKYQERMFTLEHEAYKKRLPVAIVFEGWDAAGKGGAIRRLARGMDPRGYEVVPFAAPNDVEKRHHYLWRFWNRIPKAGHITIFDRSWYGRVLVERVERFCSTAEWQRAFREINETEAQWADFGMVLIKFWLHIDQEEQLRRFNDRERTPYKKWKITDEDWRNRKKWDLYKVAVDEMLVRTSTPCAPWTVVEANSKLYARIKILKTVVSAIEERL